jgi:hypothetical protein
LVAAARDVRVAVHHLAPARVAHVHVAAGALGVARDVFSPSEAGRRVATHHQRFFFSTKVIF